MTQPKITQNRIVGELTFKDLLDLHKKDIFLSLNCHAIATIQSFDSENLTVRATVNYSKTRFDKSAGGAYIPVQSDYPILIDVPIIILGGGSANLTFPISEGDECLILFNDRDMDNWWKGATSGPVASPRLHSFSDAIALVGFREIESYDEDHALLSWGETQVGVSEDKVLIANNAGTLNDRLQDIATQLENLCTAIQAITVTCPPGGGPSSPPINAASFITISTQVSTIATQIGGLLE